MTVAGHLWTAVRCHIELLYVPIASPTQRAAISTLHVTEPHHYYYYHHHHKIYGVVITSFIFVPRKNALFVSMKFNFTLKKEVCFSSTSVVTKLHDALYSRQFRQNLKYWCISSVKSKPVNNCGKKPRGPLLYWQIYTVSMKAYEERSWSRHSMEASGELNASAHSPK